MKNNLFTLPNMVTLCNLGCGCGATVFALSGEFSMAFWLVAAAAVFDFADGLVARLTGQFSEIGRELDSLSDVVSFGVAPSAVLFALSGGCWGAFVVALCAALRLARFNIDPSQAGEFRGLPAPAAGLAVAAVGATWTAPESWAVLAVAVAVSALMVCPMRMFALKFKGFGWRGNAVRYTFLVAAAVIIAVLGIGGVAAAVGLYIVASAAGSIARRPESAGDQKNE